MNREEEYGYINKKIIGHLPWVSDCDFSFIKMIPNAKKEKYLKNQIIISQEEYNHNIYYIEKGRVKYSAFDVCGQEKTIAIIIEGNIFGEISAWDGLPTLCSVIAITDEVIAYCINNIGSLFEKSEYVEELITNLVRKNRMFISEIIAHNLKDATMRLATCILNLSKKYGVRNYTGDTKILVHFTHQQMADLMGVSRVTITNILNRMRRDKIIDYNSGFLVVKDEKRLESIANEGLI